MVGVHETQEGGERYAKNIDDREAHKGYGAAIPHGPNMGMGQEPNPVLFTLRIEIYI